MSENPKRVYKTKRSIMRGTTLDALRFLYYYGPCYKDDFIKTLGKRGSESFDRLTKKILEERKTEGFVFREIEADGKKRQAGQTATIVALSPAGIAFYKDHEKTGFDRIDAGEKPPFNTTKVSKLLWPHLTVAKVASLYLRAGVRCFCFEKPSLGYLLYNLSPRRIGLDAQPFDPLYGDPQFETLSVDKKMEALRRFIKEGAYYSKKEVMEFFTLHGENYTDSIKSVNWNGIFLSDTTLLVNFVLRYGDNKRMYLPSEETSRLLEKLEANCKTATNIYRTIFEIDDVPDGYKHKAAAVTIGIGSSHTYSEAMGNKNGIIRKNNDMSKMESDARQYDILDCTCKNFDRIYSISDSDLGIQMLDYITTYSLEDYRKEELALFNEDPRFSLSKGISLFPANYTPNRVRAIYLPVYDIKLLKRIADDAKDHNYPVMIAAKREMMDTISHCVHIEGMKTGDKTNPVKSGLFFVELKETENSISLDTFINEDSGVFKIYTQRGRIKGKSMIYVYLSEKHGIELKTEGEYTKLAKLCMGQPSTADNSPMTDSEILCRFYNKVAKSNPEDILKPYFEKIKKGEPCDIQVSPIEKEGKKERRHNYLKQVKTNLTISDNSRFKEVSNSLNISSASLARQIIVAALDAAQDVADSQETDIGEAMQIVLSKMH